MRFEVWERNENGTLTGAMVFDLDVDDPETMSEREKIQANDLWSLALSGEGDKDRVIPLFGSLYDRSSLFAFYKRGDGFECAHSVNVFDDPRMWGILLADGVRHIARARAEEYADNETEVREIVLKALVRELELVEDDPTRGDLRGDRAH